MIRIINQLIGALLLVIFINCGANNNQEYDEIKYEKLKNNNDISLEILNQLDFIEKQLERKKNGKSYTFTNAEVLSNLTGIKAEISGLGTLGNSYEVSEAVLDKWKNWFEKNKHLLYWDRIEQKIKVKKN